MFRKKNDKPNYLNLAIYNYKEAVKSLLHNDRKNFEAGLKLSEYYLNFSKASHN